MTNPRPCFPRATGATAVPGRCPRCGASFACGARDGDCWCAQLPPLARTPAAEDELARLPPTCLCPACLKTLLARAGG